MKKLTISIFVTITFFFTFLSARSQEISPYLIGTNAWLPPWMGGSINNLWDELGDAGFQLIRIGGNGAQDANAYNHQRVGDLTEQIRATGADVILQVPRSHTAAQTTALIEYINGTRDLNVRFWSIGNEPNLNNDHSTAIPVADVAAYIRRIATALKTYDPTIRTIGPTTAWFDTNYLNPLLVNAGPNNVAGTDENGNYYIDILSWNQYQITSGAGYENTINSGINIVNTINATRPEENKMSWMMSEFNGHYNNDLANPDQKTWSFNAGQMFAEMYDIGMRKGGFALCSWSVFESGGSRIAGDLGLFDLTNNEYRGRSTYYHSLMLGRHMKTQYLPNQKNISSVTISSMGDEEGFSVMIINRNKTTGYNYSLSFNGEYGSAETLKIAVDAGLEKEITGHIEKVTTQMLVFDAEGFLVRKYIYSEPNANNYIGPMVTDYSSPAATTGSLIFISPEHGSKYKSNEDLIVEVEATHPDGIDSVSLSIDGEYVGTISEAPFVWNEEDTLLAELEPGYYDLKSVAHIANGDSIITQISFNIILSFAPDEPMPVPGIIQAEFYSDMFGIQTEATSDIDGGLNVGYLDVGDWMDYEVNVTETDQYWAVFRVAGWLNTGKIALRNAAGTTLARTDIPNTGSYQTWTNVDGSSPFVLQKGEQTLRIYIEGAPFNLNYFNIIPYDPTNTGNLEIDDLRIFPLPVKDQLNLQGIRGIENISMYNNLGQKILDINPDKRTETSLNMGFMISGLYFLHLSNGQATSIHKIVKQ